jgi:anti-anti-sigma factor
MSLKTAAVCLNPQGPLVAETVSALEANARAALATGADCLVVDLDQVTTLDRDALDVLLDLHDECREGGGSLALAAPNGLCADILRISRVDQTIPVLSSLDDLG